MTISMLAMRDLIHSIEVPKDVPLLTHFIFSKADYLKLGCPQAIMMGESPEDGVLYVDTSPDLEPGYARVEGRPVS